MIPWMAVNTTCTFSMEWGSRPCGCYISALSVVIVALLGTHWQVKLIIKLIAKINKVDCKISIPMASIVTEESERIRVVEDNGEEESK